jgi:hypothetical protein
VAADERRPAQPNELAGLDVEWLGCDGHGHIALFTTAGAGFVPPGLLADVALHDAALAAIAAQRERTVATWTTRLHRAGRTAPWRDVVRRGLFAYDCHPNGGPYRRCGVPRAPVTVDELPVLAQRAARSVTMTAIAFAQHRAIHAPDDGRRR